MDGKEERTVDGKEDEVDGGGLIDSEGKGSGWEDVEGKLAGRG